MHSVMPALAAAMRPMTPALAGPKIGAASHILIRHADTAEVADLGDSVEAACAALKKQLDDGADFAALAKLHSTVSFASNSPSRSLLLVVDAAAPFACGVTLVSDRLRVITVPLRQVWR